MQVRPYRPCSNVKGPSFEGGLRKTAAKNCSHPARRGEGAVDRKQPSSCAAGRLGKENSLQPTHHPERQRTSNMTNSTALSVGGKRRLEIKPPGMEQWHSTMPAAEPPQAVRKCLQCLDRDSKSLPCPGEGRKKGTLLYSFTIISTSPVHLEVTPSYREWQQARMRKLRVDVAVWAKYLCDLEMQRT